MGHGGGQAVVKIFGANPRIEANHPLAPLDLVHPQGSPLEVKQHGDWLKHPTKVPAPNGNIAFHLGNHLLLLGRGDGDDGGNQRHGRHYRVLLCAV